MSSFETTSAVSIGKNIRSAKVEEKRLTEKGLTQLLTTFQRTDTKTSASYITPGVFRNNHRSGSNHKSSSMLALDFDAIPESVPEFRARLKRADLHNFILHSTFSHTSVEARLRLFIILSRQVSTEEYTVLVDYVAGKIGLLVDPCSRSPAQAMFLPCAKPGAEVHSHVELGDSLDVDSIDINVEERQHKLPDKGSEEFNPRRPLSDTERGQFQTECDAYPAEECDWQRWWEFVVIKHHQFNGSHEARDMCQSWSAKSSKHDPREIPRIWKTLKRKPHEKKLGFTRLKERIEERGGACQEFVDDLLSQASQVDSTDAYASFCKRIASIHTCILINEQRDAVADKLHSSYGQSNDLSIGEILSDLKYSDGSPDHRKAARKKRFDYKHRVDEAQTESELDTIMEELASDSALSALDDIPELHAPINKARNRLGLTMRSGPQLTKQLQAIKKRTGFDDSDTDAELQLVDHYVCLTSWYRSKDRLELMLPKQFTHDKECDLALSDPAFEQMLRRDAYDLHKVILDDRQVQRILASLDALISDVPSHDVCMRYAQLENGDIAIDTIWGDGSVIIVKADGSGWDITNDCDARFRRCSGALPLPRVQKGDVGDLKPLWRLLPGMSLHEKILVLSRMHESRRPLAITPGLAYVSDPGVGKTNRLKVKNRLIDPRDGYLTSKPRRYDDMAMILANNSCVAFDNVTALNNDFQNLICSAVTGGFYTKRMHHKNTQTVSVNLSCDVCIGTVDPKSLTNADALSRFIRLSPKPFSDGHAWSEDEWEQYLRQNESAIFVALLEQLSTVLDQRAKSKIKSSHRLSDYVITGEVVRILLGCDIPFEKILRQNQQPSLDDAFQDNVFLQTLVDMVYVRGVPFVTNCTALLYTVERYWQWIHDMPRTISMPDKPKCNSVVGRMLRDNLDVFSSLGVTVEKMPTGKLRPYRFFLNSAAEIKRIGNCPNAGRDLLTHSVYDVIEKADFKIQRTDEEWDLILAEFDRNDSNDRDNVVPFKKASFQSTANEQNERKGDIQ